MPKAKSGPSDHYFSIQKSDSKVLEKITRMTFGEEKLITAWTSSLLSDEKFNNIFIFPLKYSLNREAN